MKKSTSEIEHEWAVSQVLTSVDYGHGGYWTRILSGHLNYQTIHHLFPCVSQYHYPAIAPIVREVCKKYKVEFNHIPTFTGAFLAHVQHLKDMGIKSAH
jgi:acyl-lipid (8-3)-desaturase